MNFNDNQLIEVPSVIGTGLLCLDIINEEGNKQYLNGGSCGNTVAALSFLGWNSSVITRRYRDKAGEIVNNNLLKLGVNQIEVGSRVVETPRVIENIQINEDKRTHNFIFNCPACGRELPRVKPLDEKTAISLESINENFNVFYSDRSSTGINILRNVFRDRGSWTVYEPNSCRNIESFFRNSNDSHIVKFSSDRIPLSVAEKLRQISIQGSTLLIVRTSGKEGLDFSYRKRNNEMSKWIHQKAQPVVEFVDASGAGDWCTAGILFNLINRYPKSCKWLCRDDVSSALQYGQALSAISCSFAGAQGLIYASGNENIRKILEHSNRQEFDKLTPAKVQHSSEYCQTCLLPIIGGMVSDRNN
jgi:fructokinase